MTDWLDEIEEYYSARLEWTPASSGISRLIAEVRRLRAEKVRLELEVVDLQHYLADAESLLIESAPPWSVDDA